MGTKEILEQALRLRPEDRFMLVEGLIRSLDGPDTETRRKTYGKAGLEDTPSDDFSKDD